MRVVCDEKKCAVCVLCVCCACVRSLAQFLAQTCRAVQAAPPAVWTLLAWVQAAPAASMEQRRWAPASGPVAPKARAGGRHDEGLHVVTGMLNIDAKGGASKGGEQGGGKDWVVSVLTRDNGTGNITLTPGEANGTDGEIYSYITTRKRMS